MKRVSTITLPDGLEIDVLYEKGKLAYTFLHTDGKNYGNAIKLENTSIESIVSGCLVLFTNAVETKKSLQ